MCLDVSGAFDRVWHPGRLVGLRALGFAGGLLHWLAGCLGGRSVRVILDGESSSTKFINAGVPQGSVLGPLLFIIFIDDVALDVSGTSVLCADGVALVGFIGSGEERMPAAASLNQDLCNIEKWATSWNVLFGAAKCKTVTISNRQDAKDSHPCLQFFGTTLTETGAVELLGLTLSKDLSWKHDVAGVAESASQRAGLLRRVAPYLLPTQRAMVCGAIVGSGMECAGSAWFGAAPASLSQLGAVRGRAVRVVGLPGDGLVSHRVRPLGARGGVGALTLFHRMYYGGAPGLLCQLLPERLRLGPRLGRSVGSHGLAVQVPRSNLVGHGRSFVPSAARVWSSLPEYIPSLEKRACLKKEVNRYLGDN